MLTSGGYKFEVCNWMLFHNPMSSLATVNLAAYQRASVEYVDDGWLVEKPYGAGGPGFKCRRVVPGLWRWWAWPHENGGRADWFVSKGWARSRERAARRARVVVSLLRVSG